MSSNRAGRQISIQLAEQAVVVSCARAGSQTSVQLIEQRVVCLSTGKRGFRVSETSIAELTAKVEALKESVQSRQLCVNTKNQANIYLSRRWRRQLWLQH
jgi:uncharacterized lipoprotein YajG